MELKLINFRCYTNDTINLPENGITLICGDSGEGKSTILNAILFALYGELMKPYSYGATSCSVTLTSQKLGIKITRNCKPNRLIFCYLEKADILYEDEVAQGFINKIFKANCEEFQISSYFYQEKPGTILTLAPREQLSFIEKVSGITGEYEEDRNKIKERITYLEFESEKNKSEIAVYENLLERFDKKYENDKFDVPDFFMDRDTSLNKKLKDIQAKLKNKRESLIKLRNLEAEQQNIENSRLKIQGELDHFLELKETLGAILPEEDIEKIKIESEILRSRLSSIRRLKDAIRMEYEADQMKKDHIESVTKEIESTKKKLLSGEELSKYQGLVNNYEEVSHKSKEQKRINEEIQSKNDQAVESINEIRKNTADLFKITNKTALKGISTNKMMETFLNKKLTEFKNLIEKTEKSLVLAKMVCMKCPKCEATLTLENESLIEAKPLSKTKVNVTSLQNKLTNAQNTYNTIYDLHTSLVKNIEILSLNEVSQTDEIIECISLKEFQEFTLKISEHNEALTKIKLLEDKLKLVPKSVIRLRQEIKEKRFGIDKNISHTEDEAEIEKQIKELDIKSDREWQKRGDYSKYSREISSRQKNLQTYKKKLVPQKGENITISELENDVSSLETEIDDTNKLIKTNLTCLSESKKYQEYITTRTTLEKLKIKELELLKSTKGAYALDKASKIAHIKTLTQKIAEINKRAKVYIDYMFKDNGSISVKLGIKTHNKNGDPVSNISISVKIDRKGNPDVDVPTISGGEKQRINLAFLLAINDMFNSNILLLDECLNNLHRKVHYETLELLKEMCPNKQILVVSHDTIEGVCDNIIEL